MLSGAVPAALGQRRSSQKVDAAGRREDYPGKVPQEAARERLRERYHHLSWRNRRILGGNPIVRVSFVY